MNILKNQKNTYFLTVLMLSFVSFFTTDLFAGGKVIWEKSSNEYFKYADQDKPNSGKNDHPVELEEKEIIAVLELLKIRETDRDLAEEKLKPVFTAKQSKLLGLYLAKGLKNANPEQDIIFAMEKNGSEFLGGLISAQYFIAGRAFYKDRKLNIILGDYDRPRTKGYEAAYDPTNVGIARYYFDHGKRSKGPKGFTLAIVAVDGVENKQIKNTRRDDWLVVDVQGATEAIASKTRMHKEEEMEVKRKEIRQIMATEEINQPRIVRKVPDSLEERLTILKRLREKDLITVEEYAQKRKQILDEL